MKQKLSRGFTLIELLVVIAIIGILASVVLASLNTARAKGADASIKANLDGTRAQAQIVYDNNTPNGYNGAVTVCNGAAGDPTITSALNAAANAGGWTLAAVNTLETATTIVCHQDAAPGTLWAIQAPLKSATGYWCVDSSGQSKSETVLLPATQYTCS